MQATPRYDDDAAAAKRVLGSEADAFESIVARWQGPLVNLAYRYCRNRGEAEELAQEAFMKIFKGLGKWRQDSRFSPWAYAVASNHLPQRAASTPASLGRSRQDRAPAAWRRSSR